MEIPYSRPTQRDRLLFATVEEGALQPYGVYWCLGANEPTTVTFSRDVSFNGILVPAGIYVIYAFPGEEYTIRFEEDAPIVFIVCKWCNMRIRIPVE